MASIAEADEKINQMKYQKSELSSGFDDSNQAFINSINELTCSDIFSKKYNLSEPGNSQDDKKEETKPADKDLLRKELDDIDKELREMEELLRDWYFEFEYF